MSPTYQVVYLPEAEAALEKTVTYITEHDGRQRAANWLRCMIESIDKLEGTVKLTDFSLSPPQDVGDAGRVEYCIW